MSGALVAAGVIGAVGAGMSAQAANQAAQKQANAIRDAQNISAEAAAQARQDAITLFAPALQDYLGMIGQSIDTLASGQQDTINIFQQSTANADQLLLQGADAAQRAILGLPPADYSSFINTQQQPAGGYGSTDPIQLVQRSAAGEAAPSFGALPGGVEGGEIFRRMGVGAAPPPAIPDTAVRIAQDVAGQPLPPAPIERGAIEAEAPLLTGSIFQPTISDVETRTVAGVEIPFPIQQAAIAPQLPENIPVELAQPAPGTALTGTGLTGIGTARGDITTARDVAAQFAAAGLGDIRGIESRALQALGLGGGGAGSSLAALAGGGGQVMVDPSGVQSAIGAGIRELRGAEERGLAEFQRGTGAAVGELERFAGAGEQALERQAALSGAMGAEAQQRAIDEFIESPGQRFLRERAERALLRNQAAIGGLGGGNVRTALQEQAVGIAATQQQQQLENLRALAMQGQAAAGQQAQFQQAGGLAGGQLIGSLAGQAAGLRGREAQIAGQLASQAASSAAAGQRLAAQLDAQRRMQAANIIAGLAGETVGLRGQQIGIQTGAGTQLAGLAQTGGQQLADIIQGTAATRAGLQTALGGQLGGLEQETAANIANLLSQAGTGQAGMRTDLGALLGNIAVGQGTQQAGLAQNLGAAQAAGTLGQSAAIQQGLAGIAQLAGQASQQQQGSIYDTSGV